MAPASTSAYWTAPEELVLIDFLVANKVEAGDGTNFKAPTFQKAAKHLAPLYKCGAPKNVKSCSNKFCAVHYPLKLFYFHLTAGNMIVSQDILCDLHNPVCLWLDLG
jgi:hypothetical protein